jgi:mono/diheme cytochrome c family protein
MAQVINYLRATGLRRALLFNFNLQARIRAYRTDFMNLRTSASSAVALGLFAACICAAKSQPISYRKQVAPILAANCNACHAKGNPQSGLDSTAYASLMKGGKRGRAVIAGNPKNSLLVQYIEGTKLPRMPIGGALKSAEIALIKKWISEGAKSDGEALEPATKPAGIRPFVPVLPQVASLLWSKDGSHLIAGTYEEIKILNPMTGKLERSLKGHQDVVRSLTLNPDGTQLAAGAGIPAVSGQIKLWNLQSGALTRTFAGHTDSVYGVAWRPDGKQLATGSYDKVVKLWDPDKSVSTGELKEHSEAIFAAAYSPNGKYLATAGSDKAIRIWDAATGKRLYTMDRIVVSSEERPGRFRLKRQINQGLESQGRFRRECSNYGRAAGRIERRAILSGWKAHSRGLRQWHGLHLEC